MHKKNKDGKQHNEIKLISIGNEIASLKELKKQIDAKVKHYPSNLKEDKLRLNNSVDLDEKNILRVLIEEKHVIYSYKQMIDMFLTVLGRKKHAHLTKKESQMLIIKANFRAYFEDINSAFDLGMTYSN